MTRRFFDHHGEPIDRDQWTELFKHDNYRILAKTRIRGELHVQTLWMGINISTRGRPCFFETVAQRIADPERVVSLAKWPTHETAVTGHRRIVNDIRHLKIKPF